MLVSSGELKVASSTGIGVCVKPQLVQSFQRFGLEILAINQCRDVELENSKSLEFLRGGSPLGKFFITMIQLRVSFFMHIVLINYLPKLYALTSIQV
jgi:hypothetical protein